MNNPFKVLGLTPELIRQLSNETAVRAVVRSQYRALIKLYHSDVAGRNSSDAAMATLSQAYNQLQDTANLRRVQQTYLKPYGGKLGVMQHDLSELQQQLADQLTDKRTWVEAIGGLSGRLTIFELNGHNLLIHNKLLMANLSHYLVNKRWLNTLHHQLEWTNIAIASQSVYRLPLHYERLNELPVCLRPKFNFISQPLSWTYVYGLDQQTATFAYKPAPQAQATELQGRLVGLLPQAIDQSLPSQQEVSRLLSGVTITSTDVLDGLPSGQFDRLLTRLTPYVKLGDYPVLLTAAGRFLILGKLVAYARHTP